MSLVYECTRGFKWQFHKKRIKLLLKPLLIILTLYVLLWRETAEIFNLQLLQRPQGYSLFNQQSQLLNKPLQPHILLIVADDLGFNDVGYHGSEIKTPVLDDLAKTGVRLENYYVQHICTPTRGQLMTGRYDIHTGLHTVIMPDEPIGLPVVHPTMADKLREAGYATHIVGKWHLGFFEKKYFPTRRGFDSFFGFLSGHSRYFNHTTNWRNMSGYDLREDEESANMSKYNNYYSTDLFADKAIDLIQKHNTNKPLFLYLPFQSPHQPFEVPKKYEDLYSNIGKPKRRTYAGKVSCMDQAVGRVVHAMKGRKMWENTILVFTTDNGGDLAGSSNYPLRGLKGTLYEGGIRAVGFVNSPLLDKSVVGSVSRALLHVTDWFPTLVNIAGGNLSNIKPIDGVNQWETIRSGSVSKRNEILHDVDPDIHVGGKPMYSDTYDTRYRGAVRVGDWKLLTGNPGENVGPPIRSPGSNTSLLPGYEHIKLFNIAEDPTEQVDLSYKHPVLVRQLLDRLKFYYVSRIPFIYEKGTERLNPKNLGGFWGPWK